VVVTKALLVSVVVPVLNEEPSISDMLARVLRQTYDRLEVIVADGGSTDRTRELVHRAAETDGRIRLIDNPGRIQAAGLNRALAVASGDVICRLDGHSFIDVDYVERCVELLERTGADVVGGRMVARPAPGATAGAVAVAMHRWWAAGPAAFHGHGGSGPVDTVYLGCFRRTRLVEVGGWSEDVGVNEDYELNYRVREAGGVVYLDADLEVGYRPRATFQTVVKQYFRYGRSKAMTLRKHPRSITARQLVPMGLFPMIVAALTPGDIGIVSRVGVVVHVLAIAVLAISDRTLPVGHRWRLGVVAWLMHVSWSLGLWVGMLFGMPRP
jgi:succinoglycan biosynthesis protein ExoA